jgi:hypothetical protein
MLVETTMSDFVASIAQLFNFIALELKDGAFVQVLQGKHAEFQILI